MNSALSLEEAIDAAFSLGIQFALAKPDRTEEWAKEAKAELLARLKAVPNRLTDLEEQERQIYKAFVGRDLEHLPLKEALQIRFEKFWEMEVKDFTLQAVYVNILRNWDSKTIASLVDKLRHFIDKSKSQEPRSDV